MRIECFGCDSVIDAGDSAAVVDRFVEHATQAHVWPYSETALRNYARNVAEATERLTGGTERLPEIGEMTIHYVTEDRIDDWLEFFDHDAFAGNPGWASCYCLEPFDPEGDGERPWEERRALMVERLRSGHAFGYLAYVDGKPAGWVNASLRADYGDFYRSIDPDGLAASSIIGVSCFVIAPPFREHGVASALLDHVIAEAASRGASAIEAYPHTERTEPGAEHFFRGPRALYDARGFVEVEALERNTVMRRPVG